VALEGSTRVDPFTGTTSFALCHVLRGT
jgi:hypothetical protein